MSTEIVSPKQHEQRPPLEAWQLQDIQFPEEYPITAVIPERRNELQGVTLMRQILTNLPEFGITEPGDLEQFQTFLHTYIQEQHLAIYPDANQADKIIEAFIDSL